MKPASFPVSVQCAAELNLMSMQGVKAHFIVNPPQGGGSTPRVSILRLKHYTLGPLQVVLSEHKLESLLDCATWWKKAMRNHSGFTSKGSTGTQDARWHGHIGERQTVTSTEKKNLLYQKTHRGCHCGLSSPTLWPTKWVGGWRGGWRGGRGVGPSSNQVPSQGVGLPGTIPGAGRS